MSLLYEPSMQKQQFLSVKSYKYWKHYLYSFEMTTRLFTLVGEPEHFNNFIGNSYQWKTYCESRQLSFETLSGKTHACLQKWRGLLRSNTEAEIHNKKIQVL